MLHRISNDRDQELVHRLLPDNMRGILREIPSLPSQHAVLLGWVTELPIIVKMRKLPKSQCPQSDDHVILIGRRLPTNGKRSKQYDMNSL